MNYEESKKITEEFFKNIKFEEMAEHLKKNGITVEEVENPEDAGFVIEDNNDVDYDFCMNDDDDYIDNDIDENEQIHEELPIYNDNRHYDRNINAYEYNKSEYNNYNEMRLVA